LGGKQALHSGRILKATTFDLQVQVTLYSQVSCRRLFLKLMQIRSVFTGGTGVGKGVVRAWSLTRQFARYENNNNTRRSFTVEVPLTLVFLLFVVNSILCKLKEVAKVRQIVITVFAVATGESVRTKATVSVLHCNALTAVRTRIWLTLAGA